MHKPTARLLFASLAVAALAIASDARADDGAAFIKDHISDVVKIDAAPIADPSVASTFGSPVYTVTIGLSDGESLQTSTMIVTRFGDKVVPLSRPGTDGDYPMIQKMLNKDLRLTSDADLKTVQTAFDLVYPIIGAQDLSARDFSHTGNQWTLVRGVFFDKKMGFVLTTDGDGAVTDVKYVLKLP
ncbi:MAG TPA: hypothetical protein VII43_06255 [Opitutaceae bacterium]